MTMKVERWNRRGVGAELVKRLGSGGVNSRKFEYIWEKGRIFLEKMKFRGNEDIQGKMRTFWGNNEIQREKFRDIFVTQIRIKDYYGFFQAILGYKKVVSGHLEVIPPFIIYTVRLHFLVMIKIKSM